MCRRIGEHALLALSRPTRRVAHALQRGGAGHRRDRHRARGSLPRGRAAAIGCACSSTRPARCCRAAGSRRGSCSAPASTSCSSATRWPPSLMRRGEIDLCIVGADRIAANGDVANKIGTYALAVAGAPSRRAVLRGGADVDVRCRHAPPAPTSSSSSAHADEVRRGFGAWTAPRDVPVYNPAFDVTPAALITGNRQRSRRAPPTLPLRRAMKHVLAIDEGTTGVTCLVIARRRAASPDAGTTRSPSTFPGRAGWNTTPTRLFDEAPSPRGATRSAQAGVTPDAIGITNQRETVVVWERAHRPAGAPRHGVAGPADRRPLRGTAHRTPIVSAPAPAS